MSAAFDALIASQNPAYVVLAEIQASEKLGGWTLVSGAMYSTPWAQYAAPTVTPGGIYRRLDVVKADATLVGLTYSTVGLTLVASATLCQSTAGSYFFDATAGLIYVHLTDGSNPEAQNFIGAWFTIFTSSQSISFTDQPLYWPIIDASSGPAVDVMMPDLLFGQTIAAIGTLTLINAPTPGFPNGVFDALTRAWNWRNKTVTLKLGGVGLAYSDFATSATLGINSVSVDDGSCVLTLESVASIINQSLPIDAWSDTGLTGFLDPNVAGSPAPFVFGFVFDAPVVRIADSVNSYVIDIDYAGGGLGVVAVYAIDRTTGARTTLTQGTDWVGSTVSITLLAAVGSFPDSGYEFRADVYDANFFAAYTIGHILTRMLQLLGVPISQIDTAALNAADVSVPYVLGLLLTRSTLGADILTQLQQSTLAQIYRSSVTGLWTIRPLDPSTADHTLADVDFASWAPSQALGSALSVVRVQYQTNQATGQSFSVAGVVPMDSEAMESTDQAVVNSALQNAVDSSIVCQHLLFFKSRPSTQIAFEERGLSLITADVGDYAAVTRARGPIARTGRLDGQLLRLVKLTKTLGPIPTISGVLDDLGGMADNIFRLADSGTSLDWSTASAADQAFYGFLADTNRYIDSTNPLTRDGKALY